MGLDKKIYIEQVAISKNMNKAEETIVKKFLYEHQKQKKILSNFARRGKCISRKRWLQESRLDPVQLQRHIDLFKLHGYISEVLPDIFCSRDAVSVAAKKL